MSNQRLPPPGPPPSSAPPPVHPPVRYHGAPGVDLSDLELGRSSFKPQSSFPPVLIALAGLVVGATAAGLVALAVGGGTAPEPAPVASAGVEPVPTASASAEAPTLTPLARAALGEEEPLKQLEARPRAERSAQQTLALFRGRDATIRNQISELQRKIELVPKLAREKKTVEAILEFARDRVLAYDTLEMLTNLEGDVGPDLLYKVWRDRRIRDTQTRDLAEELLYSTDVRRKASKALSVALDLYAVEQCEEAAKILQRVPQEGDKRAALAMGRFYAKRGCGKNKLFDCWPCLRGNDLLKDAALGVRRKPAPL
jgi:hypothetical protein